MSFSFGQMNRITDNLYLGPAACVTPDKLHMMGITCVINCTNEVPSLTGAPFIETVRINLDDVPGANISAHFDRIADKIRAVRDRGGCTLVHCAAGVSRSATMCIAYLMRHHRMNLKEAYLHVKRCRPVVRPNAGFFRQLVDYERRLFGGVNTVSMVHSPMGFIPDVYRDETAGMVMLGPSGPSGVGNFGYSTTGQGTPGGYYSNTGPSNMGTLGGGYNSYPSNGGYSSGYTTTVGGGGGYSQYSQGDGYGTMGGYTAGPARISTGGKVGFSLSKFGFGR